MFSLASAFVCVAGAPALAQSPAPDGQAVFQATCAVCHGAADSRAPNPDGFRNRSPESVVEALTGGTMRYQGLKLSGAERRAVAEYLTGKKIGTVDFTGSAVGRCTASPPLGDPSRSPSWSGWSPSVTNTHPEMCSWRSESSERECGMSFARRPPYADWSLARAALTRAGVRGA